MKGLANKLENKFELIQFDYSTSKFYKGNFTDELLRLLQVDGKLIIDTHIYTKVLDDDILQSNLIKSEENENNIFFGVYSTKNDLNEKIKINNMNHFKKYNTDVCIVKDRYPVPDYTNCNYNKQMENIDYMIVTKN